MATGINSFQTNNKFLSSGGRNVRGFNKRYADNKYFTESGDSFNRSLLKNSGVTNTDTTGKYSIPKLNLNNLYKYTNFKFEHFKDNFSKTSFIKDSLIVNSDNPFLKTCDSMKNAIRDCGAPALHDKKGEPDWNVFAEKLISSLKHVKGKDSYDKLARNSDIDKSSNEELLRSKASHNVFIKSNIEFLKSMSNKKSFTPGDVKRLQKCYQSLFEYNLALAKKHTLNERLSKNSSFDESKIAKIVKNIAKQDDKIDIIFNQSKQHKHLVDRSVNIMKLNERYKEFNTASEAYIGDADANYYNFFSLDFDSSTKFFDSVKSNIRENMDFNSFENEDFFSALMTEDILNKMTMNTIIKSNSLGDLSARLDSIEAEHKDFITETHKILNLPNESDNSVMNPSDKEEVLENFKKLTRAAGFEGGKKFDSYIRRQLDALEASNTD